MNIQDKANIHDAVVKSIDMADEIEDEQVSRVIDRCILDYEKNASIDLDEKVHLKRELFNSLRRLDILSELLEDESIREIMINGYRHIFVERNGSIEKIPQSFESEERLKSIIQQIVAACNRIFNESFVELWVEKFIKICKKDLSVPMERLYDINRSGRQMKLYEVKEIEEYTGLNRKDLFVYEESIPPVKRKDNAGSNAKGGKHKGYKLYDQKGLEKLCMAALFKKLGATPKRINELFAEGNFDKNDVFDELIFKAGKKRQEADDIITVANVLKELNMEAVSQSFFQLNNLHGLAEQLRRELNSDETKKVIEKLDKSAEEKLLEIYRGFDGYTEEDLESDKVEAQVEKLKRFAVEVLGVDWSRFLSGQANSLVAVNTYSRDIEKRTRRGLPEFIADAIFVYQINHFWDEGESVVEDLEECIGIDYSEERVKVGLEKFMLLLNRWFGYRNYTEGESIISKLKLQFKKEGDMEDEVKLMDYICGAMKYYGNVR